MRNLAYSSPLFFFFPSPKLVQLITIIIRTTLRLILLTSVLVSVLHCVVKPHSLLTHLPIPINYLYFFVTNFSSPQHLLTQFQQQSRLLLFICGLFCSLLKSVDFWKDNQFVIECIEILHFSVLLIFLKCLVTVFFVFIIWKKD